MFGGRFGSIAVADDAHFLRAARSIVLNPIRTRRPENFAAWRWSSYQASAGLAEPHRFLSVDGVLGRFAGGRTRAGERYVEFVAEGVEESLRELLVGEIYLGDDEFIRALMPERPIPEIARRQWQPLRPTLAELGVRDGWLLEAYRLYGYRLGEIADHLGVHISTVSRALVRLERAQAPSDPDARRTGSRQGE